MDKFECLQQKVDACEGDGEMIAEVLAGEHETCKLCMECFPKKDQYEGEKKDV